MNSKPYDIYEIIIHWIGPDQAKSLTTSQNKCIDDFIKSLSTIHGGITDNIVLSEMLGAISDAFINRTQSKSTDLQSKVILPMVSKQRCEVTNLKPASVQNLIDIRTADIEMLTLIPGIGMNTAINFIKWRKLNFDKIHSIKDIFRSGCFDTKKERQIKRFITVGTNIATSKASSNGSFLAALIKEQQGTLTTEINGAESIIDQFILSISESAYWPKTRIIRDPLELYDFRGREIHDQLKKKTNSHTRSSVAILSGQLYIKILQKIISSASSDIYIMMNNICLGKSPKLIGIGHTLANAVERNIDVRVIYNHSADKSLWKEGIDTFKEFGVKVQADSAGMKAHERTIVVDGEYCIAGSVGWTSQSIYRAEDVSLYTQHKLCCKFMRSHFLEQWKNTEDGMLVDKDGLSPRLAKILSNVSTQQLAGLNSSSTAVQIDKLLRSSMLPSSIDELAPIGSFLERRDFFNE